jgi:hypothetical protein
MIKLLLGILFFSLPLLSQDLESKRYSIDDLELMGKKKEWAKVVLYLKDISKSEQNLQWKSLLERAAIGYVGELQSGGFSDVEKVIHDMVYEFPDLKDSYKFEKVKNDLFMTGYRKCFSKTSDVSDCVKSAIGVMSDKINSFELRQNMAELVFSKAPESVQKICEVLQTFNEKKGFFAKRCLNKFEIEKK